MDPGHWPVQAPGTPWIYRSISGEYACLEKRFAAELWPARSPRPCERQDPMWSKAPPQPQPPSGCDPRSLRLLGRAAGGHQAAPQERKPRSGSVGGRGLGWSAPPERLGEAALKGMPGRRRLAGDTRGPLPAGPPSYETHMLRRLRVEQSSRKPNELRPPPYISPPAYDAPHRTLPTKRPRTTPKPPAAKRGRAAPRGKGPAGGSPEPPRCSGAPHQRRPRLPQEVLNGWSYHAGSGSLGHRTGSGLAGAARRCSAESLFHPLSSPDGGSHTLPRAAGGSVKAHGWGTAGTGSAPGWQRLPSGWGFGYAPSPAGSARSGQQEGWEQRGRAGPGTLPSPCPRRKAPGQSPTTPGQRRHGGVFVIDATCVVIRAEYIPPPRREQVQLLGSPPPREPVSPCQRLLQANRPHPGASEQAAGPPPPSPGHSSLGQRAARILGLPAAELDLVEPQEAGALRGTPGHWGQQAKAAPPSSLEPLAGGPTAPGLACQATSPKQPPGHLGGRETPRGLLGPGAKPPTEPGPRCTRESPSHGDPRAMPPHARPYAKRPALCTHDLREAVSRIRRHTAPDSDTDEEPEDPALRGPMARRLRPRHEACAYSSSSSLDSSGSDTTVVPAGKGGPPGVAAGPSLQAWELGQEGTS
ncbi:dendrin [Pelodiscus sinensis]|uniref:dendrin n=1 Tax=Pelodiscus sinensis TaxID=13735 RepID=UPI003F6D04D0